MRDLQNERHLPFALFSVFISNHHFYFLHTVCGVKVILKFLKIFNKYRICVLKVTYLIRTLNESTSKGWNDLYFSSMDLQLVLKYMNWWKMR